MSSGDVVSEPGPGASGGGLGSVASGITEELGSTSPAHYVGDAAGSFYYYCFKRGADDVAMTSHHKDKEKVTAVRLQGGWRKVLENWERDSWV